MIQTDPSKYTQVSQEDWDRFKNAAKARGMNISGNEDDVQFDGIGVHVKYTPEDKTLVFLVHEPHWLAPGVTLGALHQLVAGAMNVEALPMANQNPTISKDPRSQPDKIREETGDDVEKNNSHPANVTRSTHAPHAAKSVHGR